MKPTKREFVLACLVFVVGFFVCRMALAPRLEERDTMACDSNLAQIGRALTMYSADYNDTLPRAWFGRNAGPSDATTNYKWMDAIFPYAKKEEVFTCPRDGFSKPYHFRSADNYGSYVMNNAYFLPGDKQTPPAGAPLDKILNGGNTILITDGENDFQFAWPDAARTPSFIKGAHFHLGAIYGRHPTNFGREQHGAALALDCEGGCMSNLRGFETRTKIIGGKKIYPQFTIEDDS